MDLMGALLLGWLLFGVLLLLACAVDVAWRRDLPERGKGMLGLMLVGGTLLLGGVAGLAYLLLGRERTRRLAAPSPRASTPASRVASVVGGVLGALLLLGAGFAFLVLGSLDVGARRFGLFDALALVCGVGAVAALAAGVRGARGSRA